MNTIKQGTNERRHDGGAPKGQAHNEMKEEKGHLCQKRKEKGIRRAASPSKYQGRVVPGIPAIRSDAPIGRPLLPLEQMPQAFRYVVACTPTIHLRHDQASVPLVFGLLFSNLVCALG